LKALLDEHRKEEAHYKAMIEDGRVAHFNGHKRLKKTTPLEYIKIEKF
jgi:hypothetical protein